MFEEYEKIPLDGIIYFGVQSYQYIQYHIPFYSTGKSKKDLGNMVARGIAGKMIGRVVGAVIGALSTPDEYEEDTKYGMGQENGYKIYVNVSNVASPTVHLDVGDFEDDTYEISNLIMAFLCVIRSAKNKFCMCPVMAHLTDTFVPDLINRPGCDVQRN